MYKFAIIGVAGYIAPRHLKAIKETGNKLIAALDPHDSVGILDSYFPNTAFFTEFERFDRHIEKVRRETPGGAVDYVAVCSPNYLHDAHVRFAMRVGADAICEKPLVLNPWNVDALADMERECGGSINTILQLRLHDSIQRLRQDKRLCLKRPAIDLTYITSRGNWYLHSWKGDMQKSGGVVMNIGIHFFDMLIWLFGKVKGVKVHLQEENKAAGYLELDGADVRWFLSIDENDLPMDVLADGSRTYRSIAVDGHEIEFSQGFADLHTLSYERIMEGEGFGLDAVRPSIELVHDIRNAKVSSHGEQHPFVNKG